MATLAAFNVRADVRALRSTLDRVGKQQLPFAAAKAVNATLLAIQAAERQHIREVFQVRRGPFVDRLVKIEKADFATKGHAIGRVGIQGPSADLLTKFEAGGTKTPRGLSIAVPVVGSLVKPRVGSVVPGGGADGRGVDLRPRALLSNQLLTLRAFVRPFKGDPSKRGIFIVDEAARAKAIRLKGQRGGKQAARRARPQLAYVLIRQAPIPAELAFVPTARAVIAQQFVPNLRAAVQQALATAKVKMTKCCTSCVRVLPRDAFGRQASSRDGHRGRCKACFTLLPCRGTAARQAERDRAAEAAGATYRTAAVVAAERSARAAARAERQRAALLARAQQREATRVARAARRRPWSRVYEATRRDSPEGRARRELQRAVAAGEVIKPTQCGQCHRAAAPRALHGHHADYERPLDVEWRCVRCHIAAHGGLWGAALAKAEP